MSDGSYDYEIVQVSQCIVDSLIELGFKEEAEEIKKNGFKIDMLDRLINLIQTASIQQHRYELQERLYFLGLVY